MVLVDNAAARLDVEEDEEQPKAAPRPAREPAERVVLYGDSTQLAGILTLPERRQPDRPTLVILNAGILHKVGPNRMHVRLARLLAEQGVQTFRFDIAGIGDSRARGDGRPLSEGVVVDVRETLDHLQRHYGAQHFVLMGLCAGADNALRAAREDSRVSGIILLDPTVKRTRRWYWEHYSSRVLSPQIWRRVVTLQHPRIRALMGRLRGKLKPEPEPEPQLAQSATPRPELLETSLRSKEAIEQHFRDVLAREAQIFYAISGSWKVVYNYREQLFDLFPDLPFGRLLTLHHYPHAEHTFDLEVNRQQLFGDLVRWLKRAPFRVAEGQGAASANAPATAAASA